MARPESRPAEGMRPGRLAGNARVVRRVRRELRLQRTLGVPALFSSGYGNVGSSIYYALGVTAVFALGATPFALTLAGVFFILTVFTYTEATVAVPEAGGASNFARQGFNELVSFITGWGTLLSYTVTISISAFSAVGYLAVFFPIFEQQTAVVAGAVVVILLLMGLNLMGAEEAATLSVVFAVLDLGTEVVLVVVGGIFLVVMATVAHPFFLQQIHWGTAPSGLNFIQGAAVAMVAYTGIETISNLSEEAKDPERTVPRSYATLIFAVLILFVGISIVALSALPVHLVRGQYTTLLATKFIADPVAGIAGELPHPFSDVLKPAVAILAATILLIAANAGILGASRLSFSMGTYRQVPALLNRIHPRLGTPTVAIIFFSLVAVVLVIPGDIQLLTALYIFGSTLGFTMAHASLIGMRLRGAKHTWRAPLNIPVGGGRSIPLTAVVGGLGTLGVWILQGLIVNPFSRYVGLAWMLGGTVLYVTYRKRQHLPIMKSVPRQFAER